MTATALTLPGLIAREAERAPDARAYAFLEGGDDVSEAITYAELFEVARRIGAGLRSLVPAGARAVIAFPAGLDFLRAFFGCGFGGIIAVPVYPIEASRRISDIERIAKIAANCDAELVLCDERQLRFKEEIGRLRPDLASRSWLTLPMLEDLEPNASGMNIRPDTLAMLQYTSGSVADPKGVKLNHENLLANQASIKEAMGLPSKATIVSWLPLYHDMGLIGMVLQPLYLGGCAYLLSPHHFIQRPTRWLSAISRYGAYVSGGPNFAYELCLRRVARDEMTSLDLRSWKVAFCGAEPINADTMSRFANEFARYGFDRRALYPCYGLAEASLIVSGARPFSGATSSGGSGIANSDGQVGILDRAVVSCGIVPSNHMVRIVSPETSRLLADGSLGEIWVSGPSISSGYWNDKALTDAAFVTTPEQTPQRWLRTGDLGFLLDGELFVVGRIKETIIIRGRNIAPQEIEFTVQSGSPAFRQGSGAAFNVYVDGEEKLVVVQEVMRVGRDVIRHEAEQACARVLSDHGVRIDDLVLVDRKGVEKTRNGKISRTASRKAYCDRSLPVVARRYNGALSFAGDRNDAC